MTIPKNYLTRTICVYTHMYIHPYV